MKLSKAEIGISKITLIFAEQKKSFISSLRKKLFSKKLMLMSHDTPISLCRFTIIEYMSATTTAKSNVYINQTSKYRLWEQEQKQQQFTHPSIVLIINQNASD